MKIGQIVSAIYTIKEDKENAKNALLDLVFLYFDGLIKL